MYDNTIYKKGSKLQFDWISASEGQKYAKVATKFKNKIKELGENSTKSKIFL